MADTGIDLTSFSDSLKIIYDPREVKLQAYKNNPALAMIPKAENFGGSEWHWPIWHYTDQGVGATVSDAIANQTDVGVTKFTATSRKKKYAVHRIDRETMKASVGDAYSFLSGRKVLMDQGIQNLGRELSLDVYRDGSAWRGQVGTSGISTTELTLAEPENVVHFEVGMEVVGASSTTGALRDSGNSATITAIDRTNGVLTTDSNWTAQISGLTDGDYLFRKSFAANGSTVKGFVGFGGWLPATVTATSFFGVDRTVDTTRLGGLRYSGTGKTVEDALLGAGALCFREGARPDVIFMNPEHEVELVKSLGAKAQYDVVRDAEGIVGFDSLKFRLSSGTARVIADPNCPPGVAYMLQMNTWKLKTLGGAPELVQDDGLVLERIAGEDTYQVRWAMYGEMGCYAPGYNCRVTLDT